MDESEVLRFEQQKQITKLSQAIREGAKLRPKGTTYFFSGGKSCAMGAMAEGLGIRYIEGGGFPHMPNWFAQLRMPACMEYERAYGLSIWQDNDRSDITREAIADKLEALGY